MDRRALVWVAALLLSIRGTAHAGQLAIRAYDAYGVPVSQMARAREVASALLGAAGVDSVWIDCSTPADCQSPVGRGEVVLRLVAAPSGESANVLGEALVDHAAHTGVLATVFADHVDRAASRAQADGGVVLGRAIAHEIGHLLGSSHRTAGLMRSRWSDKELRRQRDTDWMWSTLDAAEIRARLGRDPATGSVTTCRGGDAKCVRG